MHPIVLEHIARSRGEDHCRRAEHRRHVALAREADPARGGDGVRLALAGLALHLARVLDRDGRVVPTVPAH